MGVAHAAGTVRPRRMVGVAQLVERRVVVADVAGSSPVTHPRPRALTVMVGAFGVQEGMAHHGRVFMDSESKRKVIRISVWVAIVAMIFGVLSSIILATGAEAHAALKSVSPEDGSTLTAAPSKIVLTFDEPIGTSFATVTVTGPAGAVSKGKPVVDGTTVTQGLADNLPNGAYKVAFHVVSDDGHPVSEATTFTVAVASASATATPSTTPGSPTATAGSTADNATASLAPTGPAAATATGADSGGNTAQWWILGVGVAALAIGAGAALVSRSRRQVGE
jgi:copper resistance protein C